jgi:outer membrane lipoprotein-sorting protein
MKKQKEIFIIASILLFLMVLMSGCTQQLENKESIQTILQKANNIGDVYYEIIGTTSTESGNFSYNTSYTMKVWQKMPYMKIETISNETVQVMIFWPNGNYIYDNQTQKYIKIPSTENITRQKFFEEQANEILESQTLKTLGSDTIDGKSVTIIEYSYNSTGIDLSPKLWIWNEKGIPLRLEMTSTVMTVNLTLIMEYKNFVFEEIPLGTFDVS